MKTLVFSATYNEAGNVRSLLAGIAQAAPHADILIVDDGSKDGTAAAMREMQLPQLTIIERPGKMGLGTAHLLAFRYAMHHAYDVLVTMDADGSHETSSIPHLLGKMDGPHDFAIGSRYAPGGSCDYSGYRLRVSQAANLAARLLLNIRLTEFTTSFRAFKVARLQELPLSRLDMGGYSFFLTTVVECARRGFRMTEIPIHFRERGYGSSKIPPFEIFRGMQNLLRLVFVKAWGRPQSRQQGDMQACAACGTTYSWISRQPDGASANPGVCVRCGVRS
ncbi:MAG: glycosyltransferase [Comamonas sp.]